jgi:MYXO-CTERM domain-containing protein
MSVAAPVGQARQVRQPVVVAATLVCAASMLGLGLWAFLDPPSFSGFVDFAPYNEHLIHDAGAFQVGIGTSLLVALWWPDGLVVALTGFAVASGLHAISHAIDRHLGGHASDVPSLGLLTLVALAAVTARIRRRTS